MGRYGASLFDYAFVYQLRIFLGTLIRSNSAGIERLPAMELRQGVRASLQLRFEVDVESSRTFLKENVQEPPLKVVRAFQHEDGTALVHLHNVSGGILGGDQLSLSVEVGPAANVLLTTTGATRVYRSSGKASSASQHNKMSVAEDGLLEYLPDELIPFGGARYLQDTVVKLEAGAGLFWWEIVTPGREARQEIFEYEKLETRARIEAQCRLIAAEAICLSPVDHEMSALARLGPYRYFATFYICRAGIDAKSWRNLENILVEVVHRRTCQGKILWGVSSLVSDGLVVRCVSRNGREILPGLRELWSRAKVYLYGREAILPRKVN
jgi:urease accessory protein